MTPHLAKWKEVAAMPTPDPSVLPAAVAATAALFTANWTTFVQAAVALLGIIVIPTLVIRGGLRTAIKALGRVFHTAR